MTGSGLVAIAPASAAEAVAALRSAGRDLDTAAEDARRLLLAVDRPSGAPALLEDVAAWARRTADGLDERIDRALRLDATAPLTAPDTGGPGATGLHLDARAVVDLDALLADLVALGVLRFCPPAGPAGRHAAIATLPPELVARLAEQAPSALGTADGVPFRLRDRANRVLLRREIRRLERLGERLGSRDRLLLRDLRDWRDDAALVVVKLDLARARVVLGRGDLDAATHVATIVPGAGLDLHEISRDHLGWTDALHRSMEQRLGPRAGGAAAVLWLDYDSPRRLVPTAMRRAAATDAATRLPAFLDGVGVVERDAVTTLGHSYGGVVLGRTLADHAGRVASDRFVALGSPGLGVQWSGELGLRDDQELYAATFAEDPIALVGRWNGVTGDAGRAIHGPDPRRLRVVRTIELSTHDLGRGTPLDRHRQYLEPGSSALGVLADLVVRDRPRRKSGPYSAVASR